MCNKAPADPAHLVDRLKRNTIYCKTTGFNSRVYPDSIWIDGKHYELDTKLIVNPFIDLVESLRGQPVGAFVPIVIFGNMENPSAIAIEFGGNRRHPILISAAIANEDDFIETVRFETENDIVEERTEAVLGYTNCPGITHVAAGGLDLSLWNERNDWSDERIAQPLSNCLARTFENNIVLAGHDVRPVLLYAANWD